MGAAPSYMGPTEREGLRNAMAPTFRTSVRERRSKVRRRGAAEGAEAWADGWGSAGVDPEWIQSGSGRTVRKRREDGGLPAAIGYSSVRVDRQRKKTPAAWRMVAALAAANEIPAGTGGAATGRERVS